MFEIKVRKSFAEMRGGIEEAFEQIRNRRYEEGILDDGYNGVVSFGVCFCKKAAIFEKLNPWILPHDSKCDIHCVKRYHEQAFPSVDAFLCL